MSVPVTRFQTTEFLKIGLNIAENIHYQTAPEELVQETLRIGEGKLNKAGTLVIKAQLTGKTPQEIFVVQDDIGDKRMTEHDFMHPCQEEYFNSAWKEIMAYLEKQPSLWIRDGYASAGNHQSIRLITEKPWISLFAYHTLKQPQKDDLENSKPEWHVLTAPGFQLNADESVIKKPHAIIISYKYKIILVAGAGHKDVFKKIVSWISN